MNEEAIPVEVIAKGRSLEDVTEKLQQTWENVIEVAKLGHKNADREFGKLLICVGYRMYLLGVEDGMKEDAE